VTKGQIQRGEVWWHEALDEKARPYLILTRSAGIGVLTHLVAVPATSTIRGIPTEVRLDAEDGMPVECVLSLDNIRTVNAGNLTRKIVSLSPVRLHEVCEAMGFAINC
jgi:mRNA interferase MazF